MLVYEVNYMLRVIHYDMLMLVRHAELVLQDRDRNANDSTLKSRAIKLGIASVKYADLSVKRETEYRFSPSKMTSLSGNTAPYLMYAFVRIRFVNALTT